YYTQQDRQIGLQKGDPPANTSNSYRRKGKYDRLLTDRAEGENQTRRRSPKRHTTIGVCFPSQAVSPAEGRAVDTATKSDAVAPPDMSKYITLDDTIPISRPRSPFETPAMRLLLPALLLLTPLAARAAGPAVDYTRDVRPILADKCYACHGPDEAKRKAKLRLDVRESAVKIAIVAGDAEHSALIERVTSPDAKDMMPPPVSKKPRLTDAQVRT